jgi:methionyl-tRNA formyltransferase
MTDDPARARTVRALFFGTPAFSVPCLDALASVAEVVGVVCQPDKPVGRGLTLTAPPVKQRAAELGLPVVQPTKLRTGDFAAWVREQKADVALVVAYGRILPADVLVGPRLGCVNVHASLLPKYRGAAPITWAVVRGETESGVTLMQMDAGMDTGAMLATWRTSIGANETAGELSERLSQLGAQAVREGVPKVVQMAYVPVAQDDALATLAPMLKKEDGAIDFAKSAQGVHDHVRGMSPWPGAFTRLEGKIVKVHATALAGVTPPPSAAPGDVVLADKNRVVVACGGERRETVDLVRVQLEGKKPVTAGEWVGGRGVKQGDRLG